MMARNLPCRLFSASFEDTKTIADLEWASRVNGKTNWRPALHIETLLALLGFAVQETNLGDDCSSTIDFEKRIVFVGKPLRDDHKLWKLARAVGTIRLQDSDHTLNAAEAVLWTDRFARLLVLPESQLRPFIASLGAGCIGDNLVKAVAKEFTVPIYVVSKRLQERDERPLRERAA